jgi:glucose/arabinose dehydrogenase
MKIIVVLLSLSFALTLSSQPMDYTKSNLKLQTELVVDGLDIPWGMDWLPDGQLIVSEKSGHLFVVRNGVKREVFGLPSIFHKGQGGLLDVAVHPNFKENGWIYFAYSSPNPKDEKTGTTAIARAKIKGSQLSNLQEIYKGDTQTSKGFHFGTRIVFDNGYIYFCIGDRGEHFVNPQDLTRDGGKIYRIHEDGRIPEDNPFVHVSDARKAIWSYGHRNSQGIIKHPVTGEIWEHEHGPMGGDEINIIKKGANYGWPVICYGINYDGTTLTELTHKDGMEQPLYYYKPSIGPSGLAYIDNDNYGDWKGSLLIGSLAFNYLERVILKDDKVVGREKHLENIGRLRNVKIGPDGFIYVGVEGKGIFKLTPQS